MSNSMFLPPGQTPQRMLRVAIYFADKHSRIEQCTSVEEMFDIAREADAEVDLEKVLTENVFDAGGLVVRYRLS